MLFVFTTIGNTIQTSITAMAASVGMKSVKYAASTQTLEPLLETIADLKDMVVELSRAFFAT